MNAIRGSREWLAEGLESITSHSRSLRHGGCDSSDLVGLEESLQQAIDLAQEMLDELAARQPGAQVPVTWPNACSRTVPEALRFLANHARPSGGEDRFNSLHLIQLAGEIDRMASKPLYAAPPAQGIDLGQLPRFEASAHDDPGGLYVSHEEDNSGTWVRFDDVLALIDQRDAAPVGRE